MPRSKSTSAGGSTSLAPAIHVEHRILLIRGERVMLDADLAELYGVTTRVLNQAVKRNSARFPADFVFQLTPDEKLEVITICDHLQRLKFSSVLPFAFTEHGAVMAASVLNSERAVGVSVAVVRAFVRLRQLLATHVDLARKLEALEKKYDHQFREVFDAIWQLMEPPPEDDPERPRIGFATD